MINNKDNITNNNTYLILFIVFLMLIKKIERFNLSKSKNFDLLNYKNGYKVIRNKIIRNKD